MNVKVSLNFSSVLELLNSSKSSHIQRSRHRDIDASLKDDGNNLQLHTRLFLAHGSDCEITSNIIIYLGSFVIQLESTDMRIDE